MMFLIFKVKPMNSQDNQNPGSGDLRTLIVNGASTILNLFPATAPLGAIISICLFKWQQDQLNKFINEVKRNFENLDLNKLDESALKTDEFKSLVVQIVETASNTASDLKRKALAKALVNSAIPPTSRFTGKQALLRILSQLSDEEMLALTVVYEEEPRIAAETTDRFHASVSEAYVANKLEWNEEESRVACEGLCQLGLVHNPFVGAVVDVSRGHWRINEIARRLIKWCGEESA